MKALVFLTDGFEETEALATADILIRGGVKACLVSLAGREAVTGSHEIRVVADCLFEDFISGKSEPAANPDMIVLPGGPGAQKFKENAQFMGFVKKWCEEGNKTAAICAAPTVLGSLGLLRGRRAVCYPGMEGMLAGAIYEGGRDVVTDGNITTARGPAAAISFGFALVEILMGPQAAAEAKQKFLYQEG